MFWKMLTSPCPHAWRGRLFKGGFRKKAPFSGLGAVDLWNININNNLKQEKLFEQFPPVSTKEWMDKINAELKGDDFYERMVWKTGEGFDVMPFYRREDLENLHHVDAFLPLFSRGDVRQPAERGAYSSANTGLYDKILKSPIIPPPIGKPSKY